MSDIIKYTVSVTIQLKEKNGEHYMHGSYVDESYRKDFDPEIKNFPIDVIQVREDAMIAGLHNCMYLAQEAGHRPTHESLTIYIEKLKDQFMQSCIEIEKRNVKDI